MGSGRAGRAGYPQFRAFNCSVLPEIRRSQPIERPCPERVEGRPYAHPRLPRRAEASGRRRAHHARINLRGLHALVPEQLPLDRLGALSEVETAAACEDRSRSPADASQTTERGRAEMVSPRFASRAGPGAKRRGDRRSSQRRSTCGVTRLVQPRALRRPPDVVLKRLGREVEDGLGEEGAGGEVEQRDRGGAVERDEQVVTRD